MYRKPLTMDATLGRREETEKAPRLETAIAANANPARIVIAEGKVREGQTNRVDAQIGALSFRA